MHRGLDVEQGVLVVLDGSKALRAAVNEVFGTVAVQRCVRHYPDRRITPTGADIRWRSAVMIAIGSG